jgi:hypothetical protein
LATHDYGFRSKARFRGPAKAALIGGAVVLAGVLAVAVGATLKTGFDREAADYTVYAAQGSPCPQTTPARLKAEGPQLRYALDFGDMTVLRAFGEADCAWISGPDGRYPICRLSSPGSIEVKAGGADVLCMITPRTWKAPAS